MLRRFSPNHEPDFSALLEKTLVDLLDTYLLPLKDKSPD